MIVMKFGGTSVGSAERIMGVYDIVNERLDQKPIVVVSAVGGITDKLEGAADDALKGNTESESFDEIVKKHKEILKDLDLPEDLVDDNLNELKDVLRRVAVVKELTSETMDMIYSFGEPASAKIVAAAFAKKGMNAKAYNSFDIGMITDSNFCKAEPLESTLDNIKNHISKIDEVIITTGFIGKTEGGNITTFGRGGSDYSASIFGAAVDGKEIQIWTDVNGIMSSDPRVVETAKTISEVSFEEASELAYFGARVLHPKSILPAMAKNIPVRVLNSMESDNPGTVILPDVDEAKGKIKAIASKKKITLFNVHSTRMLLAHGFLARVFEVFDKKQVSVDMIATSEVSVSLTVDKGDKADEIIKELSHFAKAEVIKDKAIICIVGKGMKDTPGIAGKIFTTCGDNSINVDMISQGASELNISFIVNQEDAEKAMKVLHKALLE